MRLFQDEKKLLFKLIEKIPGEVFLFGSRMDGQKKGGDIDILILSSEFSSSQADQIKYEFLYQLDAKLDVVLFNPQTLTESQQAFINTLQKTKLN